ncbi:hypothetical protein GUITHDRAFT_115369 [Guillardia theta CCMP2712]|uniref:Uncharacterized protein n=1 Tax=Guillardia theta (strain CCMP2712) TaxID=905079 RepID=L1IR69_GUITC|nr:hypothetical protein GUITHDRAFT_115369 [Guillardia theta CCMP2712]EKX38597.1 hypothetical protein GUITHDRAFT_115369 [Guillardia theta CCMP2712]|eukprot:XP_005825577.1 hypothetical protein GUITHDRAFT_115369 [Guillardia theta CCMP2712]
MSRRHVVQILQGLVLLSFLLLVSGEGCCMFALGETNVRLLDSFKLQLPQNSWPSDVAENPLLMAIDSASLQQIPAGCKPFGPVWLISPAIGLKASAVVNLPLIKLLNRSSEWQRIGVWQNQSSSAVSTTADALGVFGVFSIDSQVVISANPQDSTSNSQAEGSSDTSESYRQSEEEEEDDEERKTDSAERVMKDKRKKEEQEQEEEEDRKGRNDDSDDKEEEEEEDGWVNDQSKDQKASASQRSESDDSSSPPSTDRVSSRRSLEGEKEEEGEKEKGEEGGGGKREGDSNGSPAVSAEGERRGEGGGGLDSSFNESSLLEPAAVNMTRQPSPHTLEIESTLTRLRKTRESALNFQSRTRQDLSRAHQGHLGR